MIDNERYSILEKENTALKHMIEQFKNLLDSIPDPVFMKDENLRWIYGNPVILNLYSIDKDNYIGKTEDQLLPEEFAESCMESDRQAVAKGGISKSEERARGEDGEIHFYEVFKVPSHEPKTGEFKGLIGVGRDITIRKKTQEKLEVENKKRQENEQQLKELTETLELKVKARTHELNEQRLKAEYLATVDVLTQLDNRRAFYEKSNVIGQRSNRYENSYAVIILDVDIFKEVNDTYGHAAGDNVLQHLATVMKEEARTTDIVGRVGGEEFAITCPQTTLNGAQEIAKRICTSVSQSSVVFEQQLLTYTVSLGVACGSGDDTFDSIVAKADKALYEAKTTGRNCVVSEKE